MKMEIRTFVQILAEEGLIDLGRARELAETQYVPRRQPVVAAPRISEVLRDPQRREEIREYPQMIGLYRFWQQHNMGPFRLQPKPTRGKPLTRAQQQQRMAVVRAHRAANRRRVAAA